MAIHDFLRNTYCRSIYVYGTDRFTKRDGCKGIREEYRESVQQYFAGTYDEKLLEEALENGWINQQEYDETRTIMQETVLAQPTPSQSYPEHQTGR
ncbi:hypothetical protein YDYSY3_43100 [Paenibacillus chitinolyticus]|uniref:hypothetical protein n=1 Tax=Paenibacillus chitinolyticus TaxID=79263 RepID=UPI0026E4FF0E|nr:hypothetical protein [Paenibacillus chitinolyticus]GKS13310.1 hypothetical protein YDYSY3_43100 [Paenibacillus chitinolyticus]